MTNLIIPLVLAGALHLTSLDSVQQLRPSLHYLDMHDAAQRGEDEPTTAPLNGKGKSLTVQVREQAADSRGASFTAPGAPSRDQILAPLLEAEQEQWVELKWNDENVRLFFLTPTLVCLLLSFVYCEY